MVCSVSQLEYLQLRNVALKQFSRVSSAIDLKEKFHVTMGVPRVLGVHTRGAASLCQIRLEVLQRSIGVKFIWGEVKALNAKGCAQQAHVCQLPDEIAYDYGIICAGCNFGPFKPMGEAL